MYYNQCLFSKCKSFLYLDGYSPGTPYMPRDWINQSGVFIHPSLAGLQCCVFLSSSVIFTLKYFIDVYLYYVINANRVVICERIELWQSSLFCVLYYREEFVNDRHQFSAGVLNLDLI